MTISDAQYAAWLDDPTAQKTKRCAQNNDAFVLGEVRTNHVNSARISEQWIFPPS